MGDGCTVERFRYAPRSWETLAGTGTMAEQVRGSLRGTLAFAGLVGAGALAVRSAVRAFKPDVIHAHWWFPSGVSVALAQSGVPTVITMHGSDIRLGQQHPVLRAAYRWCTRRARVRTAVSAWLRDIALQLGPEFPVDVAPMPVDVARYAPGEGRREARLLFVGRMNAQKGPADLIAAFARMPEPFTLDMVGDGPEMVSLQAEAARLGLAGRIRWHGALAADDVAALYRASAVVAMPSRDEGLGLVAVEAMLCETPVVAYRSGGLRTLVGESQGGVTVEPGDIAALAAALVDRAGARTVLAPALRADAARMRELFSPAAVGARYRALFARAVA